MKQDDLELTPRRGERGRRASARRHRAFKWSLGLVIVIGLLALVRPAYRWTKARRADQLAAQGAELVSAGKLNDAAAKYRAALQLDPLGYQALKGAAHLATQGNRPEALDLWEQVVRLPACTVADRQDYAAALLAKRKIASAEKLISQLLINSPDVRTLNLAASYAAQTSDLTRAIEFARLAAARAPEDDFQKVQLAGLLAKSPDDPSRTEARQILWSLADKPGNYQRAALEGLARAPDLSAEEKGRVLAKLTDTPAISLVDAFLAADLRLQIEPQAADAIFDETTARWAANEPAEVARWLNGHRQGERVLKLISAERALTSEPLLIARLDALASSARWSEIEEVLSQPNLPIDRVLIEAFRARTATARAAPLDAELHWDRAVAAAGSDPARLHFVANFAEQSHARNVALKAYDQLARVPEEAAAAQAERQRILLQQGAGSAARSAAEKLVALSPNDPSAQAQLAYLNLLANVDVDANAEKARALATRYPDRLAYRVAAALGCLRKGDVPGALAQFNGPSIDWQRTPARWRAVYAAILRANNDAAGADKIIANIHPELLTEEEHALIAAQP